MPTRPIRCDHQRTMRTSRLIFGLSTATLVGGCGLIVGITDVSVDPCSDGIRTVGESDIDCGGPCEKCDEGSGCSTAADCNSGFCVAGACVAGHCKDGLMDADETGVDCGGTDCLKCNGHPCSDIGECTSGYCTNGVCCDEPCTTSCYDCNVSEQVGTCTPLPLYYNDSDCNSGVTCDGIGHCKKWINQACSQDAECVTGVCNPQLMVCKMPNGATCFSDDDCDSANCVSGTCQT